MAYYNNQRIRLEALSRIIIVLQDFYEDGEYFAVFNWKIIILV